MPVDADLLVGLLITAATEVFGVNGVGILLADEGQALRHVASTDDAARALEEVAFNHLRRRASEERRKADEVAREILEPPGAGA